MHSRLEIVMPPVDDVEKTVAEIMHPFCECPEDEEDENLSIYRFWDWYQLGGRFSGRHLEEMLGQDRVDAFYEELKEKGVTVSGLQRGKQELRPASQIHEVDRLWRERFPEGGEHCVLFKHSGEGCGNKDICTLDELPSSTTALKCIIAGPTWEGDGIEARDMRSEDIWNGCRHERTDWDLNVWTAIDDYKEKLERSTEDWRKKMKPAYNWLAVTVDYHT